MLSTLKDILGIIVSISSVLGIFTAIINKSFKKRLKPIEDRLDQQERDNLETLMHQWRYETVSFAGSLRRNVPHTRYEFESVFKFIDNYENAVKKLGITNHLFDAEVEYIEKCYHALDCK